MTDLGSVPRGTEHDAARAAHQVPYGGPVAPVLPGDVAVSFAGVVRPEIARAGLERKDCMQGLVRLFLSCRFWQCVKRCVLVRLRNAAEVRGLAFVSVIALTKGAKIGQCHCIDGQI